jgi:UDP-N-acetylmuramate dehydrogenase
LINTGNATAKDIETLGETIISQVRQKTYITLEWEVKRVGIDK